MPITLKLHGNLKRFSINKPLHCFSIKEITRLIEANFPEFRSVMAQNIERGIHYKVLINGKKYITEEQLNDPLGNVTVSFYPVVAGSGGVGKILLGVGLISLGLATGGIGFLSAPTLILTGASLALSGIVGLFNSPQNDSTGEDKKSFIINGQSNSSQNGSRVPIVFGRLIVGSAVVSAQVTTWEFDGSSDD